MVSTIALLVASFVSLFGVNASSLNACCCGADCPCVVCACDGNCSGGNCACEGCGCDSSCCAK